MALIVLLAWCGLILQFSVTLTSPSLWEELPSSISFYFSFFTILTNLLIAAASH
jgi:hypothetical protein